jgi:hypothetical protein
MVGHGWDSRVRIWVGWALLALVWAVAAADTGFAMTLTSYVQMLAKQSAPNAFLQLVVKDVKGRDLVMLKRFYSEEELSYATTQKTLFGLPSSIRALSASPSLENSSALQQPHKPSHVPLVVWSRAPVERLVYTKKLKYPSNFGELAQNARDIIRTSNDTKRANINSLRYHLRMKACQFVSTLGGNPSLLPVPVVFTTPLNNNYGIYSSDVAGKTCHPDNFDFQNNVCRGATDLIAEMAACDKDIFLYKRFLDKNKNIALIITCQHHFFSHSKLLSLPFGIRPQIVLAKLIFVVRLSNNNFSVAKTTQCAASSEGFWYQTQVC